MVNLLMNNGLGVGSSYNYGARFYDPSIGRFLQTDPLAESNAFQNPFVYADNNPISNIDLFGMDAASQADMEKFELAKSLATTVYSSDDSNWPPEEGEKGDVHVDNDGIFFNDGKGWINYNDGSYTLPIATLISTRLPKERTSIFKDLWDSPPVRLLTGDAVSFGFSLDAFTFAGVSATAYGGILLLHGPEAGSYISYSDVGLVIGMESSGTISFNTHRVFTLNSNNIRSEDFGGIRTNLSVDIGAGLIGGANFSLNNPNKGRPLIFASGLSVGVGATSPFMVGGNFNLGYTHLYNK